MFTEYIVLWDGKQETFDDYYEALEIAKYLLVDETTPSRRNALVVKAKYNECKYTILVSSVTWVRVSDSEENKYEVTQLFDDYAIENVCR